MKKRIVAILAVLLLAVCCIAPALAADGYKYSYTYTYDYWEDVRESPDAYRVKMMISTGDFKDIGGMKNPQGLFVRDRDVYICDTGNNRILQLRLNDDGYERIRVIDSFTGDTEPKTFNSPRDIYVMEDGTMFIADYSNNRVVRLDKDLNWELSFVKPTDNNFDQNAEFLPRKLVADVVGRVYVLSQNVNKGIVKFENDGKFNGFIGANKVRVNLYDQMWKMIATKEQRARMESFVPTEYENIALDPDGFFYVVTKTFKEEELRTGSADPVRRLNAVGDNILVQNGAFWVIGDLEWAAGNTNLTNRGPSKFADVTVLQDDIYMVLDSTHNRIFGYDQQGNMLWAFGGVGNADGFFNNPAAIEHMGTDVLVLDQGGAYGGSLTVMTPTEYGQMVYKAIHQYRTGDYTGSAETWTGVLSRNGNSDSAYIGIGRALLQQEKYDEAMKYFKAAEDDKNYSEAWRLRRMELVEQNIVPIFIVVAAILALPPLWRRIKKIKWEVKMFHE